MLVAIRSADNSSTHDHDEPRSEDGDPLKNPVQRTQKNNPDHALNHDPEGRQITEGRVSPPLLLGVGETLDEE